MLNAGQTCTISVQFAPTAVGNFGAVIELDYTPQSASPTYVLGALAGSGVTQYTPPMLSFNLPQMSLGSTAYGQSGAIYGVSLRNSGPSPAQITGISASGDFAIYSTNCGPVAGTPSVNVAAASQGASITASSTYDARFPASAIIDSSRTGAPWAQGGGWNDGTAGVFPDWIVISLPENKTVDRVTVYTLQDNYQAPIEPTDNLTFSQYGLTDFTVYGATAGGWVPLASITGNNRVKRTVTFPPFTTSAIHVVFSNGLQSFSRVAEVEAWTPASTAAGSVTLPMNTECQIYVRFTPTALDQRTGWLQVESNGVGSPNLLQLAGTGVIPVTYASAPIDDVNAGGPQSDAIATSIPATGNQDDNAQAPVVRLHLKEGADSGACNPNDGPCPPVQGDPIVITAPRPQCSPDYPDLCFPDNHSACFGNCSQDPAEQLSDWINRTNRLNQRTVDDKGPQECQDDAGALLEDSYKSVLFALNDHGKNLQDPLSEFVLDPIHSGTGNKHHTQTDYVGGDAWPLVVRRTYNSQPFQSSAMVHTPLGPGWFLNWDRSVMVSGATARVSRGDGKSFVFTWNGTSWVAANSRSELLQTTDASGNTTGWAYKARSGAVDNFNPQGRLTSLVAPSGETFVLGYDARGRLSSVRNPLGRSIQLSYDAQGRMSTLVDPAGSQTVYVYDARGRLTSTAYPDGRTRQYRYEDTTNLFALTSIVDETGQIYASFDYYSDGRAWRNSFAGAVASGNIAYATAGTDSTTTTPDGTTWTRSFTVNSGKVQLTRVSPSCTDCGTGSDSFTYDALEQLSTYTNRSGIATTYTYNDRGLPLTVTEGGIRTRTYTWHPALNLPTQIAGQLSTKSYQYDSAGRVTQETISGGGISRTATYTYDAQGRLSQVKGPRTDVVDVTSYGYDAAGNLATVTNALGQVTRYTSYDAHGRNLAVTYPNGTTAAFSYDARGRLTSKTIAGRTRSYTYNTVGDLASEMDPAGVVTSYAYDAAHRLIRTTRLGEATVYTLDSSGRAVKTEVFDNAGILVRTSSVAYDGLGRVKQRVGANGQVTQYTYDDRGNLTQSVDALGNTTSTSYDALNRPILITDPLLYTVQTTYDDNDKVTSSRDPGGNTTTYANNAIGEQTGITSPDSGVTSMTLNTGGMVATRIDARGASATYTYDALGRITQTSFSDGTGITKTYDVAINGVGRLAQMTDPSGATSYTYDSFGGTASKTQVVSGISRTLTYARDAIGRATSITYPSGRVLSLTYQSGRMVSLTFNGQTIASGIQYFPFGGPESWLFGNGKEYTRYIDKDGRIAGYLTPSGQRNIGFDAAGRIVRIDNVVNSMVSGSQTFTYDALGRLLTFSGYTSGSPSESQSFTYSANGNRLTNTLNGVLQTYTYAASSNRLATVSVGGALVVSNTFDASGNTISDGTRTFNYDARGRLVQSALAGSTTTYLYNGNGQRVAKSNASSGTIFVYDDSGHVLGEYDAMGALLREVIWLDDTPLAVVSSATTGFIWTDHLNTPREITDSANHSLWKWDSLPFGETAPSDNPSGLGSLAFNQRFPGQYFDIESGLHQNDQRDYDPRLGRYIESDPIGLNGGPNTYSYVSLAPTLKVDPTGLLPLDDSAYFACFARCVNDRRLSIDGLTVINLVNTGLNSFTPATGQGFGLPSHATSWQHQLGSAISRACNSRWAGAVGKFLGRLLVASTVFEGAYDWAAIGSCALDCVGD